MFIRCCESDAHTNEVSGNEEKGSFLVSGNRNSLIEKIGNKSNIHNKSEKHRVNKIVAIPKEKTLIKKVRGTGCMWVV